MTKRCYTLDELDEMSRESESKLDQVVKVLRVKERHEEAVNDQRRSNPAEGETITAKVQELFPDGVTEAKLKDIARQIGVRPNQGNASRIRHKLKQLQIAHQRAAE